MKNREMLITIESEQKSIEDLQKWAYYSCDTVKSIDAENFIVMGTNYNYYYRGLNVIIEAQTDAAYRVLEIVCNSEMNKHSLN